MVEQEQKQNETSGQPKIGDRVTNAEFEDRKGKLIGVLSPEAHGEGHGWRCLVKWDDTALQDSWHDAGDLEFQDVPPLPGNGV